MVAMPSGQAAMLARELLLDRGLERGDGGVRDVRSGAPAASGSATWRKTRTPTWNWRSLVQRRTMSSTSWKSLACRNASASSALKVSGGGRGSKKPRASTASSK
jgi:hypothetical protein